MQVQYISSIESHSNTQTLPQQDYDAEESALSLDQLEMSSIAVIDPEWKQTHSVRNEGEEVKVFEDTQ